MASRYGTCHSCVECNLENHRKWRNNNKAKCKEINRKRYLENKEKHKEYAKKWKSRNPQRTLEINRKYLGMPLPTRMAGPVCECCGKNSGKKALSLDHDHVTGEFRGWLCTGCNRGIGMLGDTIEGLEKAIQYLKREI